MLGEAGRTVNLARSAGIPLAVSPASLYPSHVPDLSFPMVPRTPAARPTPVELVVRRNPLSAIREALGISLDELVNERRLKSAVSDLYRVTRRIEDESWLRRRLLEMAAEAWIAAHL